MSIIERAAALFESATQIREKPSHAIEGSGNLEQDVIERAALEVDGRRISTEGKAGRPGGKTARTLRIDRDRLRRQNIIAPDGGRTAITESFQRIKRQILANAASPRAGDAPANLVQVTSALPGEGKTFCAINLAISIALERDRTALLVDVDVAKPSIPKALGLEAEKGLVEVLLDRRIDLSAVMWKLDIGKLWFVQAGRAQKHATELLASNAMRELLLEMAERYQDRVIIFDSPPLLAASEAGVLANQMGQIVVVVEAGKTSEVALKNALARIDSRKITGLLLNKAEKPSLGHGYSDYG